ncbi:hypothetical protein [Nitrosophilus alvini]|uniref:hypothetical protein n=1 Tax=Nitrosophilus alvini TaxID=2714855 RepID=UPI00190A2F23|nr:hypothetical protein [Nitrosophilus alvini]
MKKLFIAIFAIALLLSAADAKSKKSFTISFGDGGMGKYEIVDNSCYVYTLNPKSLKDAPKTLNSALTASLVNVKKQYAKKADGFVNIKVHLTPYKNAIIYQVCGDVVKTSKRRK